jgi:hypothetical protein
MSDQAYYLVVMVAGILLPLIPAYILFRALPSDASVTGPFKGLKLKLGGAFAGYFIVFIALQYFFPAPARPQSVSQYEVWHIKGRASLEGPEKLLVSDISVEPSVVTVADDGSFWLDLPIRKDEAGKPDFPILFFHHVPCHTSASISLGERKQGGIGGASADVKVTEPAVRTIEIEGIHLQLDSNSVMSDGHTQCKS